jgi:hypothetical protein
MIWIIKSTGRMSNFIIKFKEMYLWVMDFDEHFIEKVNSGHRQKIF